jgi:hypothetical protein
VPIPFFLSYLFIPFLFDMEYLDVKIHLIDNLKAVEITLDGNTDLSSFVLQNISKVEVEALVKYHHRIDGIKSH